MLKTLHDSGSSIRFEQRIPHCSIAQTSCKINSHRLQYEGFVNYTHFSIVIVPTSKELPICH